MNIFRTDTTFGSILVPLMETMFLKFKVVLWIIILTGCASTAQTSLPELNFRSDFDLFSGPPLSDKYGDVSSVKVVFDLESQLLFFVNSTLYRYHHDFCRDQLFYTYGLAHFNEVNYTNHRQQRFLLGTINYFESLDQYALEISTSDFMPLQRLLELYKRVSDASFMKDKLAILVNSSRLQRAQVYLESYAPVVHPSEIYKNLTYQAVSKQRAYGRLRFVNDLDEEMDDLKPTDIIVINETPVYLPLVAGIIVTEFQTPLSHLTLLGQNRKIPICAYKLAYQNSDLKDLENQMVRFSVGVDTLTVERSNGSDKISTRKRREIKLKYNLTIDSIMNIESVTRKSYKAVGNKAANFAILYRLSQKGRFKTPESAFVIPFYFYDRHLATSNAQPLIDKLLLHDSLRLNTDSLRFYLQRIRNEIKQTPMDVRLLVKVKSRILYLGDYRRMRFRSSTNAEDARGFSGAGLYSSKTGILMDSTKPIDKAIKKVWASMWSFEAFSEREYYRMNHRQAYMGVLVHRSFPDEQVNGVAITKNLYRKDYDGFVVNAQIGEESVVKPSQYVVSDQFVCYPESRPRDISVDVITTSSLNNGELVMTETEIQLLANQLEIIKEYFHYHAQVAKPYFDFGMDVEFKLDGETRQLYIKQARLYND